MISDIVSGAICWAEGTALTASILHRRCTTPELAVGFYARAFARQYHYEIRGVDQCGPSTPLYDWFVSMFEPLVADLPSQNPWHHASRGVLPGYRPIDWGAVETQQDLVDELLIDWRETCAAWRIVEFVQAPFGTRAA
jgi:hypothetical protein